MEPERMSFALPVVSDAPEVIGLQMALETTGLPLRASAPMRMGANSFDNAHRSYGDSSDPSLLFFLYLFIAVKDLPKSSFKKTGSPCSSGTALSLSLSLHVLSLIINFNCHWFTN